MAETLISPGVFLNENDLSQITSGPIAVGAALIGPTVIGPVNIPTKVTTYSQYKSLFGAAFVSGGTSQEYLTSMAALNYFEQGGDSLLVTRVASGSYISATASIASNITAVAGTYAAASIPVASFSSSALTNQPDTGSNTPITFIDSNNNYYYFFATSWGYNISYYSETLNYGYFTPNNGNSYTRDQWTGSLITFINTYVSSEGLNISASTDGTNLIFSGSSAGVAGGTRVFTQVGFGAPTSSFGAVRKGTLSTPTAPINSSAFDLETISVGTVMNNATGSATNGLLPSGSTSNIRWEITNSDSGSGQFNLIIRRGDDYENNKTVLETWNNLSLDPNQNNYISYIIGDAKEIVQVDEFGNSYLQQSGYYQNKSRYVRVKAVNAPTPNYFDTAGIVQSQYTSSLPIVGSGSLNGGFSGATGAIWGCFGKASLNLFELIPNTPSTATAPNTNIQGVAPTDYSTAISLLGNQDAYDFNVLYAPGLTSQNAPSAITSLVNLSQTRGDNIAVIDVVGFGQSMTTTKTQAQAYDNSYAATYWPWVQLRSRETGRLNFVPPSTLIPAIYEYNDKISAEWFAPAGLNRGGLSTVLQPERRLSVNDRNFLYQGKVNPIATFPGVGTVVYGQKTLQAKPSALDRVNVRRLLISLKRYIKQIAETLVFEPNTQVTRNKFLNQVNPYLEYVQQKQGLYAFQVVMDDTNNTPDVIDRNQLVGSIYLQPTKTAEFIQLDFNVLPTGASFGA
jgi:phage tail sheath protein FI